MNKRIFVDFDGVILDTISKFEELKDPNITWDDFFLYFNWDNFLKECDPINNSVEILKKLQLLKSDIYILTKINTVNEMEAKIHELRYNRGIILPIIFVPYKKKKNEVIIPNDGDILIDDTLSNLIEWEKAGGIGYLYNSNLDYPRKVESLDFLMKEGS